MIEINFEFRFHAQWERHEAISTKHKQLLAKCLKKIPIANEFDRMSLYPVPRAGNSGSDVFYLDAYNENRALPKRYIAKFQTENSAKEESSAAKEAVWGNMCSDVFVETDSENDLGVIIYDLAKIERQREFRNFFLDFENSDTQCEQALRSTLRQVGKKPNPKAVPKKLLEDYAPYFNRRSNPLRRMEALSSNNDDQISIAANNILERVNIIRNHHNHPVFAHLVHGDLHARNVIVDVEDSANIELIDFEWVHYGHPAKDFVLMEVTLKYMLLPEISVAQNPTVKQHEPTPMSLFLRFEKLMCDYGLEMPSEQKFCTDLFDNEFQAASNMQRIVILRVFKCICVLRTIAKNRLNKYCENFLGEFETDARQQYFIGLFLVSLGVFGISDVDKFWALIGLEVVGQSI